MKKTIAVLSIIICTAFIPETPKSIKLELSIEEAQAVISAVSQSKTISAYDASVITSKINTAYQLALADTAIKKK